MRWTPYRLEVETKVSRANTGRFLRGEGVPDADTISKIAAALGADQEELQALADIHRLGPERVRGVMKYAAALGESQPANDPPARPYVVPAAPDDAAHPHETLTGPGVRHLSAVEAKLVDELLAITGGDLNQVSLYKGSPVWLMNEDERTRALQQQVRKLKPAKGRKKLGPEITEPGRQQK